MILGLDLHGVIDKNPYKFKSFAKQVRKDGGKVFIITGMSVSDKRLKEKLEEIDFTEYDFIYSIEDTLMKEGIQVEYIKSNGEKMFNLDIWNSCKAKFCKENKVNLHIDDCREYGKYFETPFGYFDGEDIEIVLK